MNIDVMRCAFIVVWLGPFPVWFDFFLESCRRNAQTFDWLIFTDQPTPSHAPSNVLFFPMDLATVNRRIADCLPYRVTINSAYKLCDLKAFYGLLFRKHLEAYTHWGHCDIDIVWGDLETFLTPDMRKEYDIVTVDSTRTSGFCTVYKNENRINRLCMGIPNMEKNLQEEAYMLTEEWHLPQLLAQRPDISISYALRYLEQPDSHTVLWENGRMFGDGREYALLHMHTWFYVKQFMTVESGDIVHEYRWRITREGFFSGKNVPVSLSNTPRTSEGILIAANAREGDNLLSLVASICTCDARPILVVDCGLTEDQKSALSEYANILRIPVHAYAAGDASIPDLIELSPFKRTLWLAPYCFVLQPLDEAFTIMQEHLLISMHHDVLSKGALDTIRGPAALASFPQGTSKYPHIFHASTDVIGYRAEKDKPVTDAWKQGLVHAYANEKNQDTHDKTHRALMWAVMVHCPHIVWSISSSQVWNAMPLTPESADTTFSKNRERGDRIVNRSWPTKPRTGNRPDFMRSLRSIFCRSHP